MSSERERLERGPDPQEPAPEGTVTLTYAAPEGPHTVLDRVRDALLAVIPAPNPWPSLEEWRQRLPAWFVEACSDDVAISTCVVDKWSLRAWVWWFQPEQRRWTWWDGQAGDGQVVLQVSPTDAGSLLLGALEWLLEAAGAKVPKK